MKKTALIGIVIAIVIVGIAGTYAVSLTSNEIPKTPKIGFEDSAEVTIDEGGPEEAPMEEEGIGFEDSAEGTIDNPTGTNDTLEITVEEIIGFSDEQP